MPPVASAGRPNISESIRGGDKCLRCEIVQMGLVESLGRLFGFLRGSLKLTVGNGELGS